MRQKYHPKLLAEIRELLALPYFEEEPNLVDTYTSTHRLGPSAWMEVVCTSNKYAKIHLIRDSYYGINSKNQIKKRRAHKIKIDTKASS